MEQLAKSLENTSIGRVATRSAAVWLDCFFSLITEAMRIYSSGGKKLTMMSQMSHIM
jgi:hypothetical protein